MTDQIYNKTPTERIAELEHDSRHLYFIIGSLTDAAAELPPLCKKNFINNLKAKAERADQEHAAVLWPVLDTFEALSAPTSSQPNRANTDTE